jgi:hypothetical protein
MDHGEWVLSIAYYYAPSASFYPLLAAKEQQTSDDETKIRISQAAYGDAVQRAIDRDIDILNVSAGRAKPDCTHGSCSYCIDTKRATKNDITVIASAGNCSDDPVHCPSNQQSAISVGGVEFECGFNSNSRQPTNKPPNAYWTKEWNRHDDYPETATFKPYCTTKDCAEDGNCNEYLSVTSWDRNPIFSGNKPDVLSPLHFAAELNDGNPFVWAGSSFAAPVISGCIAGILSDIESERSPIAIQEAIRDSTIPVQSVESGSFDADRTKRSLADE